MRLLGVRLRDLRRIRPLKKVLVTSSIPREGKTTIAANLACALAYGSEEKTLLIEGDVRLPALRQMFGIERVPGICELVQDGRSLSGLHLTALTMQGCGFCLPDAFRAIRWKSCNRKSCP